MPEARRPDTTFWVDAVSVEGDRLTLDREESLHLLRVHRARPGAAFDATDGLGNTYSCVLESEERGLAVARIAGRERERGELGLEVHLLVGIPDPGAAESVVEHAVPLGVGVIDFAACERSGRPALGAKRLERLGRLARSGVKQARRSRLPRLRSSESLEAALALIPESGDRLAADPEGGSLFETGRELPQTAATLAIGPPGGFTEGELERLRSARFRFISFGNTRLTTQTAALALVASYRSLLFDNSLPPI